MTSPSSLGAVPLALDYDHSKRSSTRKATIDWAFLRFRKSPSPESDSTGSSSSSDKRYPKLKTPTKRAPLRKSQQSVPITEVANKILTKWGLQPGKGLGPNGEGIRQPILPCQRPMHRGLGRAGPGRN
ncbi:hypothetical protein M0R45_038172 [Rubus argutus]|uniref:G-patch domain-containing protein n=1 Tax=Rubus argutus TaxID=59490 RepID=A0AAW1W2S0_RUBAR